MSESALASTAMTAPKSSTSTSTSTPTTPVGTHATASSQGSKSSSGASRKRKASNQLPNTASKVARSLKKCDRRVCDLVSATPFCFVRASEK